MNKVSSDYFTNRVCNTVFGQIIYFVNLQLLYHGDVQVCAMLNSAKFIKNLQWCNRDHSICAFGSKNNTACLIG